MEQNADVTLELPEVCCGGSRIECADYGCELQKKQKRPLESVFVYGTLKRGRSNHYIIAQDASAKCLFDDAFISGEMYDMGRYPAVVLSNKNLVFGELWYVDHATLLRMDKLEGHPNYYRRMLVPILGAERNPAGYVAWVYTMRKDQFHDRLEPMRVGNWMKT